MIIAFDVLEHFKSEQALELCELIYKSLRQGGTCLIRVPNAANPLSLHLRYDDITHEMCYTEKSLKDLLPFVGFSKCEVIGLRTFISSDRVFWRGVIKNLFYRPLVWLFFNFLRGVYLLQGESVKIVEPNILAVASK
jgi:hypothetical protein